MKLSVTTKNVLSNVGSQRRATARKLNMNTKQDNRNTDQKKGPATELKARPSMEP